MLSVHLYHQPSLPTSTRRHQHSLLVERGRSRNVSQVALARRRSEERRRRAAAGGLAVQPSTSTSRATSSPRAPSVHNNASTPVDHAKPVASSSSCHLSSPPPSPTHRPMHSSEQPNCASVSTAEASDSRQSDLVTSQPYPIPVCEPSSLVDEDVDSLSLQDQMQQAYAACQTTCLPSPAENHCHCRSMHRARVLYLKTQGIDVTSDDDPRIEQVRDEDFVFVPGGELVLDEESLAALNEERERREKEAQERKWRARGRTWEVEAERARAAKAYTQRKNEDSRSTSHTSQRLEFRAKGGRSLRSNPAGHSRQCADASQPAASSATLRIERVPTFRSNHQTAVVGTTPNRVSFKEVVRSLHGSLFPDTESQRARSPSQSRLLDSLLQTVVWQEGERRRAKTKAKVEVSPRSWRDGQLCQAPEADNACVACSVSSDSTISRTNSWASSTSDASSATCITSPPSSPISSKLQLPVLVNDKCLREQIVHSCRSHRKSRFTVVALTESPLMRMDDRIREQSVAETIHRSSHQWKGEKTKPAIVTRVRQSVHGLVDFASRMQQSYLRTIQFAVSLQPDTSPLPAQNSMQSHRNNQSSKPSGYRVNALDVQRFAPQPVSAPTRELNFPSELNIPLGEPYSTHAESGSAPAVRVFAPLAFVPPSPLRPREVPAAPEWRLRPVANPCTLRLKALANCLSGKGIAWEGRAHTGSLGCGRERLTGIAFEGLGGSRLAFEATR